MDSLDEPKTFGSILVTLYVSFIFSTESYNISYISHVIGETLTNKYEIFLFYECLYGHYELRSNNEL